MLSVIIPTYNRLSMWQRGLLLESLRKQTKTPNEILICDDNSTDGTALMLPDLLAGFNCPVRLYETTEEKKHKRQASALPDNVLFLKAHPESTLVHLDDDGWIDPDYIAKVAALEMPGVYFAKIRFYDPDTLELFARDSRLNHHPGSGVSAMEPCDAWGAAYVAPNSIMRDIGGHEMLVAHMMGSDSRLGWRLSHRLPLWFHGDLVFHHLGPSYLQALKLCKRYEEMNENRLTPVRQPEYRPDLIANGGAGFWEHGLDGKFRLIWQND